MIDEEDAKAIEVMPASKLLPRRNNQKLPTQIRLEAKPSIVIAVYKMSRLRIAYG